MLGFRFVSEMVEFGPWTRRALTSGYSPDYPGTFSIFFPATDVTFFWAEHVFIRHGGITVNDPVSAFKIAEVHWPSLPPHAVSPPLLYV